MLSGSTKLFDQCNLASVHTRDSWLSMMMCTPLQPERMWRSTGFWVELWQHSECQQDPDLEQGYETLLNEARAINPHAEVWFGGSDRHPEERCIRVRGTPLGTAEFVRSQLDATEAAHQLLLQRIPAVQDLQSAWLLLLFCASSRATFYSRVCHLDHTEAFARQHDLHTWQCLSTLLGQQHDVLPQDWGSLPFHLGGLGLRGAHRSARAAFWGSWADCLHTISQRHGDIAHALESPPASAVHIQAAVSCGLQLAEVGYDCPDWLSLLRCTETERTDLSGARETWPKGEVSGPCWRSSRAVVGGDRLLLETTRQSAGEKRTGVETSVSVVVGMCSSTCFRLFTPGEEGVRRC